MLLLLDIYDKEKETDDKKTIFHLDIALYIEKDDGLYHIKRDDNNNYSLIKSAPKKTYERQKNALDESKGKNSKRNATIITKLLKSKNHINGVSSIFITDKIISYSDDLDTFSLVKKIIKEAKSILSFKLFENPKSELIDDSEKLHDSAKKLFEAFEGNSTVEVHKKLNVKFNNKLSPLDKEDLESKTERHFGG